MTPHSRGLCRPKFQTCMALPPAGPCTTLGILTSSCIRSYGTDLADRIPNYSTRCGLSNDTSFTRSVPSNVSDVHAPTALTPVHCAGCLTSSCIRSYGTDLADRLPNYSTRCGLSNDTSFTRSVPSKISDVHGPAPCRTMHYAWCFDVFVHSILRHRPRR